MSTPGLMKSACPPSEGPALPVGARHPSWSTPETLLNLLDRRGRSNQSVFSLIWSRIKLVRWDSCYSNSFQCRHSNHCPNGLVRVSGVLSCGAATHGSLYNHALPITHVAYISLALRIFQTFSQKVGSTLIVWCKFMCDNILGMDLISLHYPKCLFIV